MRSLWQPQELTRRTKCPLCAAPTSGCILGYRWDALGLNRCYVCGLLFVDPVPSEQALQRCYEPSYFQAGKANRRLGPNKDYFAAGAAGAECGYAEIASRVDLRGKAVLEVGCATGALLHRLRTEEPARRVGIDISDAAVTFGRRHYGLDLRCTTLENARFSESEFDLIVMFDVIEHVPCPAQFFAEAVRCLRDGGAVVLRTPNADSYDASGKRWTYLHCGLEHVQYLSHRTVKWLAQYHGMIPEEFWSEGCPSLLPYERFHPSRVVRLVREPRTILSNAFYRWKLRTLPRRGLGADFFAVLRKPAGDLSASALEFQELA